MIFFTFKVIGQAESGMVSGQISEAQLRLGIKLRRHEQDDYRIYTSHIFPLYKCDTCKLDSNKFTMLNRPSPKIRPLANTMIGISCLFNHDCQ